LASASVRVTGSSQSETRHTDSGAAANIEYAFVALSHLSFQRAESQRFCIVPVRRS
jgi:hypothetical protein